MKLSDLPPGVSQFDEHINPKGPRNKKPWRTEPDEWSSENMHAHRHPILKHWCGYVGVWKHHPLFNKKYSDWIPAPPGMGATETTMDSALVVHGGVTYTRRAFWDTRSELWWIGFDCGHSYDYCPGMPRHSHIEPNRCVYRDLEFVKKEILNLANQLARWKE